MSSFARRQWFLFAIAGVLVIGAWLHEPLRPVADAIPRDALVFAIMLAMSAPLDLRRSLTGPKAAIAVAIGAGVNAGLAGPLAYAFGGALPPEVATGLIVAALAPCTLASAAVWTRRGGGNEAVALAVTVVTNVACFATLPAWALLLIGRVESVDPIRLGLRLLMIVVVPISLGQAVRGSTVCRRWCDRHRHGLSLAAQSGLLAMVLVGAVRSGDLLADPTTRIDAASWVALVATAAGLHLTLFAIAWRLARSAGAPTGEALAAAVAGSQKTLAVGLSVAIEFGPLAILPMIAYHGLQLIIDTVLVERLGDAPTQEPSAAGR